MEETVSIMVIDDEPVVGQRLKPMLEEMGHKVEVFVNPVEAMEHFRNQPVDIVITDIRMDDMEGIEILEQIQFNHQETKVVMITGYATLELARESMAKGAFDFIAKPFKFKEIRNTIAKAVDAIKAESESRVRA